MAFNFDEDIDWIFMYCKQCWDYRKFVFTKPIDWTNDFGHQEGICTFCNKKQKIALKEAREYYDHLNDHNQ